MDLCLGYGIAHKVIIIDVKKNLLLSDVENREFLTIYKSIGDKRVEISPMLILTVVLILKKWVQENNLDKEIFLSTNPTNYFNNKFTFKWLKHFEHHSCKT